MSKTMLVLAVLFSNALAFAVECVVNEKPIKTINRCNTTRSHGGEIGQNYLLSYNGSNYSVISAPQTYQVLHAINCVDKERSIQFVGDVYWDCVGNQEIAGITVGYRESQSPLSIFEQEALGLAYNAFNIFLQVDTPDEKKAPADIPAPISGIRYWNDN